MLGYDLILNELYLAKHLAERFYNMYTITGHFLNAIAIVLLVVLRGVMLFVGARAILSWVSPDPYNPIVRFIHNVTEPILYPVRKRLPLYSGGIDFSPVIVFLVALFIEVFLVDYLFGLSASFLHKSAVPYFR